MGAWTQRWCLLGHHGHGWARLPASGEGEAAALCGCLWERKNLSHLVLLVTGFGHRVARSILLSPLGLHVCGDQRPGRLDFRTASHGLARAALASSHPGVSSESRTPVLLSARAVFVDSQWRQQPLSPAALFQAQPSSRRSKRPCGPTGATFSRLPSRWTTTGLS